MNHEALSRCSNEAQIERIAGHVLALAGFDYWAYTVKTCHPHGEVASWSLHNLPDKLWSIYGGEAVHPADPVFERSRQRVVPRIWTLDNVPPPSPGAPTAADLLHQAAIAAGITGGMCLPVHDTGTVIATLTLATIQPITLEALESSSTSALLFAMHLHEACREYAYKAIIKQSPQLSPRELQCLTWASRGKTSWEIGRVMGISEHTAIFHLRNAAKKLGTASRQQAVAKSIQMGLLAA